MSHQRRYVIMKSENLLHHSTPPQGSDTLAPLALCNAVCRWHCHGAALFPILAFSVRSKPTLKFKT